MNVVRFEPLSLIYCASLSLLAWLGTGGGQLNAATYTWIGAGGSTTTPTAGNMGTASNWNEGGVPGASDPTTEFDFVGTPATNFTVTNNIGSLLQLNILNFNTTARTITLGGSSLQFVSNGATTPTITQSGAGGFTFTAPVDLASNLSILGTGAGGINFSGAVSGSGMLTVSSSATVYFSAANSFTGGIRVAKGQILTQAANALGTGAVTLDNLAKWTITGVAQSYNNSIVISTGLPNGATIDNQRDGTVLGGNVSLGSQLTLRSSAAGTGKVTGLISGSGNIVKGDSLGNWILTNNNTYTGTTAINAGKLGVTGTTSGQGSYSVATASNTQAGTLVGNGTIGLAAGKNVNVVGNSVSNYARMAPSDSTGADSTIGTLAVTWAATNAANKVTFNNYSSLLLDIDSSGSSDLLKLGDGSVSGILDLSSSLDQLELNWLGSADGSNYTLVTGFGTLTGTFDSLVVNGTSVSPMSSFTVGSYTYSLVYDTSVAGEYSILLTSAVPEPSTFAMAGLGFLLLIGSRRWRQGGCPM